MSRTALILILVLSALLGALIAGPVTVVANVRGKKYTIEAETVEEFTEKAESAAELEAGQQSVLFRGKVLSPSDRLEDIGIQENGNMTQYSSLTYNSISSHAHFPPLPLSSLLLCLTLISSPLFSSPSLHTARRTHTLARCRRSPGSSCPGECGRRGAGA